MDHFEHDLLTIRLQRVGSQAVLAWIGQSGERNPADRLNPYLNGLICRLKGLHLRLSFEKLEYMNSSTIPPIIEFMKKLDENGIPTLITYDAASKWQSASFKALKTLSMLMTHIRVQGD
jgi:hypothetical protein